MDYQNASNQLNLSRIVTFTHMIKSLTNKPNSKYIKPIEFGESCNVYPYDRITSKWAKLETHQTELDKNCNIHPYDRINH